MKTAQNETGICKGEIMFCKGKDKCEKCGMMAEYTMQKDSNIETVKECVFQAMFKSMIRQEQSNIRIQAAIEHSRNQQNTDELETQKAVAHGFIGLIHTFQNNPEAVKQAGISKSKLIKMVELTESKQEKISKEQIGIANSDK